MAILKRQFFSGTQKIKGVMCDVQFVPTERDDNNSDDNAGDLVISPHGEGTTYSSALAFLSSICDEEETGGEEEKEATPAAAPAAAATGKKSTKPPATQSRQLSLPAGEEAEAPPQKKKKNAEAPAQAASKKKDDEDDPNAKYSECVNIRAVVNMVMTELGDVATWPLVRAAIKKLHAAGVEALQKDNYLAVAKAKAAGAGLVGAEDSEEDE